MDIETGEVEIKKSLKNRFIEFWILSHPILCMWLWLLLLIIIIILGSSP